MTPRDRWKRAEELFLAVADMAPADRQYFLRTACGDDLELLYEVESLIEADQGSAEVIDAAIETAACQLLEPLGQEGQRLGAYRILHELGRGGMGDVLLAARDDDQFSKLVAIKIVKHGTAASNVVERFRRERQILANLDHPNISRLLDGGSTPDGRPYFVMEYVEGVPLDIFCREQALSVKERLCLFQQVCGAVAYAHRSLVIHRDLKPANILVNSQGVPKLLDFGIAKLLDGTAPLETAPLQWLFTPAYASPEQVLGAPCTTATDVYSLGAILYEILTGQRAQVVERVTPREVERVVCDTEVGSPSQLVTDLDPDLDNIVLKAMAKDPDQRYAGVDQLCEDVARWLDGRPVLARPASFWYRLRKFTRRNVLSVAAVTAVAASLIAATLISLQQSRRAESEREIAVMARSLAERTSREAELARRDEAADREIAEQQREEARRERSRAERRLKDLLELADRTLTTVHDSLGQLPGSVNARRAIVQTTLDYLSRFEKDAPEDEEMRTSLAMAWYKTGMIQWDVYTPGLQEFENGRRSFLKARSLLDSIHRRHPDDPDLTLLWLNLEDSIADSMDAEGRPEDAIRDYGRLIQVSERLVRAHPGRLDIARQCIRLHSRITRTLRAIDGAQAREHTRRQLELIRESISRFPAERSLKDDYAVALTSLAGAEMHDGDAELAVVYYRQAIEVREQLIAEQPDDLSVRRNLMVTYGNLAGVLGVDWSINVQRPSEARPAARKAVELARLSVSADAANSTARTDLAMALLRLGCIPPDPGQESQSLAALNEAAAIFQALTRNGSKVARFVVNLATAQEYSGRWLERIGKREEAERFYRLSLAAVEPLEATDLSARSAAAASRQALALWWMRARNHDQAARYILAAIAAWDRAKGTNPTLSYRISAGRSYSILAQVRNASGQRDAARDAARQALAVWNQISPPAKLRGQEKWIETARELAGEPQTASAR